jgi:lipoprotein-anchoring transpeptidase ErfK/SrfK
MRLWKRLGVATGQSEYPTPIGHFTIVTMQRHPWWYPPDSEWAQDEEPIPPGPGNPLGTRWMGLSASGVGIHGTPDSASIGYSASHGCIRMRIAEAEWLFQRVRVGTPVFIVRA